MRNFTDCTYPIFSKRHKDGTINSIVIASNIKQAEDCDGTKMTMAKVVLDREEHRKLMKELLDKKMELQSAKA